MSWPVVPLADLLVLSIGGVWGKEAGVEETDVQVWRVTELKSGGQLDPSTAAHRSIPQSQYRSRALQPGDLLLEKSGGGPKRPVGRVGIVRAVPAPAVCANFMQLMRPDPDLVDARYLHLFLNHFHERGGTASMQTASTNIRNIKASEYVNLRVPLPNLHTQRGIVEMLEDHLSRIDAAEQGLGAALARADAMVTAGLWHATHNMQGAEHVKLADIAEVRLGRQRSPKNHTGPRMRPYLRAANVDWGALRLDDVKSMHFTESEELTYRLEPGDVLLTEASGSPAEVGKSALYEGTPPDVCFQNTLLRVRCHSANPEFVQKYLLAEARAGRFLPESRGVGINHLGRARLASLSIELPDANAQASAVRACVDLVEQVARIRSAIGKQLQHSTALRRSLLGAAFSGRLAEQHREAGLAT